MATQIHLSKVVFEVHDSIMTPGQEVAKLQAFFAVTLGADLEGLHAECHCRSIATGACRLGCRN